MNLDNQRLTAREKQAQRKHLFVEPTVQGALVIRVILYWMLCLLAVALMLLCWQIMTGPPRAFYSHLLQLQSHYGPALLASLLLLPLVVIDAIRLSNRFAGPMFRLRRSMRSLAHGERVEALEFRDADFWHEFAREFNGVLARLQPQDKPTASK